MSEPVHISEVIPDVLKSIAARCQKMNNEDQGKKIDDDDKPKTVSTE